MIGQTISHYKILAKVGGGGMGLVYKAEDTKLKRTAALKFLPPQWSHDEGAKQRFIREAQAASAIEHPNICNIYGIEETEDGRLFIAMSYYEGQTLKEKLDSGPLPAAEALGIARQAAEGLAKAHARGIVHRDIKPGNLMFAEDDTVKIVDFGLAKFASAVRLTQDRTVLGTVAYMSPEQTRSEDADSRTDVWSLGAVLYEMLSGRLPFGGAYPQATIYAIRNEDPPPLSTTTEALPEGVERVVRQALSKDPSERFESAAEMARELRAIEEGTRVSELEVSDTPRAQPEPQPGPPPRFWKRVLLGAGVGAVVLAVALGVPRVWRLIGPSAAVQRVPIAVLPLINETGNSELEDYRLAATQLLVLDLTGSPNINVLSYERLLGFVHGLQAQGKDMSSNESIPALADHSNAEYVLIPTLLASDDTWRLEVAFRSPQTGLTTQTTEVEAAASGSAEDAVYSMVGRVADEIQEYFRSQGPGEAYRPRPAGSRPRTLGAAADFERGINAYAERRYARALRALQQVVETDPEFSLGWAWMGRIYGILGYGDEAVKFSEHAARLVTADTPPVDVHFIEATLAESQYEFADAEERYRELVARYPDDPTWYAALGSLYERQARYDEAIDTYHRARDADPHYVPAYVELSRIYTAKGDALFAEQHGQEALDMYRALGNRAGEARALLALGYLLFASGDYPMARERSQAALNIFTDLDHELGVARAHKYLGDAFAGEGNWDEVLNAYQNAVSSGDIREKRLEVVVLMNIGLTHAYLGDLSKVPDYFEQSLQAAEQLRDERRRAEVLANMGSHLLSYGPNPEQGLEYANRALSITQDSGDADFELFVRRVIGNYQSQAGRYDAALRELRRSFSIASSVNRTPQVAGIRYDLGRAYYVQNAYALAEEALQQAVAEFRNLNQGREATLARILVGRVQSRLGDFETARAVLTDVLRVVDEDQHGDLRPEVYLALGELANDAGSQDEARTQFERGAALWIGELADAASVEAKSYLGWLEAERGNVDQGLAATQASLVHAQGMGWVHVETLSRLNLARIHVGQQAYERAIQTLSAIPEGDDVSVSPELLAQCYYVQHQAFDALGDAEAAERAYQQGRQLIETLLDAIPERYRERFTARRDIQVLLQ